LVPGAENGDGDMRFDPTANPAEAGDCDTGVCLDVVVSNPKAAKRPPPARGPGTDIGLDLKLSASLPGGLVWITLAKADGRLGEALTGLPVSSPDDPDCELRFATI
jgi:hypothetical protein